MRITRAAVLVDEQVVTECLSLPAGYVNIFRAKSYESADREGTRHQGRTGSAGQEVGGQLRRFMALRTNVDGSHGCRCLRFKDVTNTLYTVACKAALGVRKGLL